MTTKKSTGKILPKTEAEVMFKSDSQCCVCQKKGDHIHHLNGRINHNFDNLALLCFKHHNLATITGSLSKKLSKETIIKYREHHYKVIDNKRAQALKSMSSPISKLNEEVLLTATKNAVIILELDKIKEEFFDADWDKRGEILSQIHKYSNHSTHRIAFEIFEFLTDIVSQTRSGMPYNLSLSIFSYVLNFFPSLNDIKNPKTIEIAKRCIHIGDNLTYDALIHCKNLAIAQNGLSIIKFIYRTAKQNKNPELMKEVNDVYDQLEETLKRPERKDLANAQELVKIYRADLNKWDLAYPPLPIHLQKAMSEDENKGKKPL